MTLQEMAQETINFWMANFRRQALAMGKERLMEQAMACARLTRKEMDDLKEIGLDEATAWTEARNLYCLAPPPSLSTPQKSGPSLMAR